MNRLTPDACIYGNNLLLKHETNGRKMSLTFDLCQIIKPEICAGNFKMSMST
jgi:hypothetical protein